VTLSLFLTHVELVGELVFVLYPRRACLFPTHVELVGELVFVPYPRRACW
jgi:hypothetical protein